MATAPKRPAETKRRKAGSRAKFPLVLRFFLATGLVIALVVAIAVGLTIQRSHAVARTAVDKAIANAGAVYKEIESDRLQLLSLGARSLGRNVDFASYIQFELSPSPQSDVSASTSGDVAGSSVAGQEVP